MILLDRGSTSYDLALLFRGRRNTLETWPSAGRQLHTQLSIFEGSLTELLRFFMFSTWKMEEAPQIASFLKMSTWEKGRSLAELLRC